jgi:hypothetical protein
VPGQRQLIAPDTWTPAGALQGMLHRYLSADVCAALRAAGVRSSVYAAGRRMHVSQGAPNPHFLIWSSCMSE